MVRILKILALILVIGFLGWGLFNMEKQNRQLEAKLNNLESVAAGLEKDNKKLQDNIEYFSRPENLLKELKSLLNYHQPGEKMMIIAPDNKAQ